LKAFLRNSGILSLAIAGCVAVWGQSEPPAKPIDNPAAEVRAQKSWEFGPFVNGGSGVADRSDYQFFWAGFQAGKALTPVIKAGPFTGQFELGIEIIPFWQAYTPAPHTVVETINGVPTTLGFGGGRFTGVSVEPVVFRWNFATPARRFEPWVQAAAGSLYTTHKFPPEVLVPKGTPGGTSVFNFTPQGGVGFHYFLKPRRSVDFGVNAEHISSASLGDKNPGVNASIQVQIGYTWWK
jgi:hypothetical protein